MPTLEEWEQALAAPRRVEVESSPTLIQEVLGRHLKKDAQRRKLKQPIPQRKGPLSQVTAFAPQKELLIVPAYMLLRLGVVTTPAVENLADICSFWAYLRYLWAFDIPPPGRKPAILRLSEAARGIDFHQKGLLSDQIGVGMAAVLLGTYLDAPLATDVSVAMGDPDWPIEPLDDTSPDYLFFNDDQSKLFIVECKGTQTSRSTSLDQLRRGTEQVPSLKFTDGRTAPSLVVATCLARRGTRILIIDPPGDEEVASDHPEKPERVSGRHWKVRNDAEFSRATRLIAEAKVLSFAGADEDAAKKLERAGATVSERPRSVPRRPETGENEFGKFRGVRQRVGVKDRFNVDVFQGLDVAVYSALLSEEPARTAEERQSFRARTDSISTVGELIQPVVTKHEKGALLVRTAAPDGSFLEVRVSPP